MTIDEFTDTYSDDLIYLREARVALLTHPLRNTLPILCNASFCRLYAIVMVGSIESMLERWRDGDKLSVLTTYFSAGGANADRVNSLRQAFINSGLPVSAKVFDDYLAIKYIRNAIVHASWETATGNVKQDQLDWIVGRGFPIDTRKLTSEHFQRFEWVNENMMLYIAMTGLLGAPVRSDLNEDGAEIEVSPPPSPDTRGIIRRSAWPQICWSNLDRISSAISDDMEGAAAMPDFPWVRSRTNEQLKDSPQNEAKRLYYLSAQAAAKEGWEALQDTNGYAEDAAWSWAQFVAQVPEFNHLSTFAIETAVKTFRVIHKNDIHPKDNLFPPLREDTPLNIREQLVTACFERLAPLTAREVAEAYALGERAKHAIVNVMPLRLFAILLPIIASERCGEWQTTAKYVADVFEVGQSWYASLEGYPSPQPEIDFYRQLNSTLSSNS